MEYINKIELQGRVGSVRSNVVGETRVINFSLVTEYLYKTKDGGAANEVTWHYVVAWDSKEMPDFSLIRKGISLNVKGRLKVTKYTAADGSERQMSEVAASQIRLIPDEE